jgi:hypothetical protein
VLAAQELGNERDIKIFPLEGKDARPEEQQPQDWKETTYQTANSKGYMAKDGL